jgi:hypothetical protein
MMIRSSNSDEIELVPWGKGLHAPQEKRMVSDGWRCPVEFLRALSRAHERVSDMLGLAA